MVLNLIPVLTEYHCRFFRRRKAPVFFWPYGYFIRVLNKCFKSRTADNRFILMIVIAWQESG